MEIKEPHSQCRFIVKAAFDKIHFLLGVVASCNMQGKRPLGGGRLRAEYALTGTEASTQITA